MKILIASAFNADSPYAHAINTVKMADGFAKLGHRVTLVCREATQPFDLAQLFTSFALSPDLRIIQTRSRRFGRVLNEHGDFACQAALAALRVKPDFAFCRSYAAPVALSRLGIPVVVESHAHPGPASPPLASLVAGLARRKALRGLVTIAPILKNNFVHLGVPPEKVWILPDAVDLDLFRCPPGFVRDQRERPRVAYAGHLYDYKGIPDILGAAALMPDCDFVLAGGTPEDIVRHRAEAVARGLANISFVGMLPHSAVPHVLWNADVLLLPPSAKHSSAQWTSPVKLGEYLSSGTPVVATRIPALEYWLRKGEVCFAQPDDPASLVQAVRRLLMDTRFAEQTALAGKELAESLSYKRRCQAILHLAAAA